MIPADEFFALPEREQAELVANGHVVVDGQIAETVASVRQAETVHVFDGPVRDRVITHLQRGRYTINELVAEFPLEKQAVDDLLSSLKYDRLTSLADHDAVIRTVSTEGVAYTYTVEALPFETRTWDPTLSLYLLAYDDAFPATLPSGTTTDRGRGYPAYTEQLDAYWGFPESEVPAEVEDAQFVESALGPLPVPDDVPDIEHVRDRLLSVDEGYARKQFTPRRVLHGIKLRKSRCRRNPSLAAFQEFALYLADVNRYASLEHEPDLQTVVEDGADLFFRCLFGQYQPEETAWRPFTVTDVSDDLSDTERQIVDVVRLQPTKNAELVDRWGFADGSALSSYLYHEFDSFAVRNADSFICATESARRRVQDLQERGAIQCSKTPPAVPVPAKTPVDLPDWTEGTEQRASTEAWNADDSGSSDGTSGVDWTQMG
jgi:hypothetical protein